MIKTTEQIRNLIHLNFDSQQNMNLSFLRPTEYNENYHFKGRVFSLQDYIDWEISIQNKFDYLSRIQGINMPATVLTLFYNGTFNPTSVMENRLLETVKPFKSRINDIYLIGTFGRRTRVHRHEEAHGLYYIDQEYKESADKIVSSMKLKDRRKLEKMLEKEYYDSSVWQDEIQAYLVEEEYPSIPQTKPLVRLFKKHRRLNLNEM